jgi:hypothetical protein
MHRILQIISLEYGENKPFGNGSVGTGLVPVLIDGRESSSEMFPDDIAASWRTGKDIAASWRTGKDIAVLEDGHKTRPYTVGCYQW